MFTFAAEIIIEGQRKRSSPGEVSPLYNLVQLSCLNVPTCCCLLLLIVTKAMSSSTGKYLSLSQRQQLLEILTEPNIPDIDRKRIQIILFADEGKSQGEIRKLLDCTAATASKWILIAESGKIDRWQKYRRGRPSKVDQPYLDRLKELISKSPRDFGYSFKRWSGVCLARHLEKEFGVALTPTHINRLRKQLQPIRIVDLSPSAKA